MTYLGFGLKRLLARVGPLSGEVMLSWVRVGVLKDAIVKIYISYYLSFLNPLSQCKEWNCEQCMLTDSGSAMNRFEGQLTSQ